MLSRLYAYLLPAEAAGHGHVSASGDKPDKAAEVEIDPAVDAVFSNPMLRDSIFRQALVGTEPRPTALQQRTWANLRRVNSQFRDAVAEHGSTKESIRIQRNLDLGRAKHTSLRDHRHVPELLRYAPNGSFALSWDLCHTLLLWHLAGAKPTSTVLYRHLPYVAENSLAFSSDSLSLTVAEGTGGVCRWDLSQLPPISTELLPKSVSRHLTVSPCGKWALSAEQNSMRILDLTKSPPISIMLSLAGYHTGLLKFSPDGTRLANSTKYRADREVWDLTGPVPRRQAEFDVAGCAGIDSLCFSADNARMVGLPLLKYPIHRNPSVWDLGPDGVVHRQLTGHDGQFTEVAMSPDGSRVLGGAFDGSLMLWNLDQAEPSMLRLEGHTKPISLIRFSPDGTRALSTAKWQKELLVWDLTQSPPQSLTLIDSAGWVASAAFAPCGTKIAATFRDKSLRIWDFAEGKVSWPIWRSLRPLKRRFGF